VVEPDQRDTGTGPARAQPHDQRIAPVFCVEQTIAEGGEPALLDGRRRLLEAQHLAQAPLERLGDLLDVGMERFVVHPPGTLRPGPAAVEGVAAPYPDGVERAELAPTIEPDVDESQGLDETWKVIVWDDPVNLIEYVAYVFRKLFGYSEHKAMELTMQVHNQGRAIVADGPREQSELDCYRLHRHGLWATLER
jgi:ATP-dependent Clp protease adaptor protein ClpS